MSPSVVTFMDNESGEDIDLENGTIHVSRGKQDVVLGPAMSNSAVAKFCDLAADVDLLRLMLFLRHEKDSAPNRNYPLRLRIPLFVTMDDDWFQTSVSDMGKRILEELTERQDKAKSDAKESTVGVLYQISKMIYEDSTFRKRLRQGRLPRGPEADEFFERLFAKHSEQTDEFVGNTIRLYSANHEVMGRFEPVIYALRKSEDARVNHLILSRGRPISSKTAALEDALAKLEGLRSIRFSIIFTCMECLPRHNLDPYLFIQLYPGSPEIIQKCQKCTGKTVFTNVVLEIPSCMAHLFFESLIQKLVLSILLSRSKRIKKVYTSKSVRRVANHGHSKSYHIDILAITDDGRAVAIDVNTTSVRGEIMTRANDLRRLCKDTPISKLICIDADPDLEDFSRYGDSTVIMHAKHIAKIVEFVEGVL